jgi:hypothetical protein
MVSWSELEAVAPSLRSHDVTTAIPNVMLVAANKVKPILNRFISFTSVRCVTDRPTTQQSLSALRCADADFAVVVQQVSFATGRAASKWIDAR